MHRIGPHQIEQLHFRGAGPAHRNFWRIIGQAIQNLAGGFIDADSGVDRIIIGAIDAAIALQGIGSNDVATKPGVTTWTLMPYCVISARSASDQPTMACLAAQ